MRRIKTATQNANLHDKDILAYIRAGETGTEEQEGKEMQGYKKLIVYQKSRELTLQIRRASVSIMANIAEGYVKSSTKEYLRFLDISLGSTTAEVEVYLDLL